MRWRFRRGGVDGVNRGEVAEVPVERVIDQWRWRVISLALVELIALLHYLS